jgi:hypothetical protein
MGSLLLEGIALIIFHLFHIHNYHYKAMLSFMSYVSR